MNTLLENKEFNLDTEESRLSNLIDLMSAPEKYAEMVEPLFNNEEPLESSARAVRPDLNGSCFRAPGSLLGIWLIDQGYRRAFTSSTVFWQVYASVNHVRDYLDLIEIPQGPNIPPDFSLITYPGPGTVYLLDNGRKRPISSYTVFINKYSFDPTKIRRFPRSIIDVIPGGPALTGA